VKKSFNASWKSGWVASCSPLAHRFRVMPRFVLRVQIGILQALEDLLKFPDLLDLKKVHDPRRLYRAFDTNSSASMNASFELTCSSVMRRLLQRPILFIPAPDLDGPEQLLLHGNQHMPLIISRM